MPQHNSKALIVKSLMKQWAPACGFTPCATNPITNSHLVIFSNSKTSVRLEPSRQGHTLFYLSNQTHFVTVISSSIVLNSVVNSVHAVTCHQTHSGLFRSELTVWLLQQGFEATPHSRLLLAKPCNFRSHRLPPVGGKKPKVHLRICPSMAQNRPRILCSTSPFTSGDLFHNLFICLHTNSYYINISIESIYLEKWT